MLLLVAAIGPVVAVAEAADTIIVQSTTSTQNSGLYGHILPIYAGDTGHVVKVVAAGTGQAIKNARNCDGDVLLVHSKADEEAFVAAGRGLARQDVMYNDFVIIGPGDDPAEVEAAATIADALKRIATSRSKFVSRGDDSGTHKAEHRFWAKTNIDPTGDSGTWYIETGQGMGGTLNVAVQLDGYVISDRSTWLTFGNRFNHRILFEGDAALFNQYGVIVVNPAACPSVKLEPAQAFAHWLTSAKGQAAINSYRVNGQQLFFGNAE
ncbi:MAG: substrate-binding domain-containing protein [Alphaproteobacteria bacterium]|nr:substrate-binding domain-containing protein [Alphaproteobacteria bacterium]